MSSLQKEVSRGRFRVGMLIRLRCCSELNRASALADV
jgi:hypothetical protein